MGLLALLSDSCAAFFADKSRVFALAAGLSSLLAIAIVINVLLQLIRKNPNEPPVVFHWVPFFGSTITYGIDPFKFFFACREKVCCFP